jgi:hypothetical protein
MTSGETVVFVRDARIFECTLHFRVDELVGVDRDELHWEAFWRVRVDGALFGSLRLMDFLERDDVVEQRVHQWYSRERIRRAGRSA